MLGGSHARVDRGVYLHQEMLGRYAEVPEMNSE